MVGRGPLNNTDIASSAYGHTYTVFANKTEGAVSCQAVRITCIATAGSYLLVCLARHARDRTAIGNSSASVLRCVDGQECDADPECNAWTYVIGGACCGKERCCRHKELGCARTVRWSTHTQLLRIA